MAVLTQEPVLRRRRRLRLRCNLLVICLALLAALTPKATAQTSVSSEYQVKAVFLFNFAQFVDWPARSFLNPDAPLVIGILGENPFGSYLDDLVRGEKVGTRPLVVRRVQRPEEILETHILFVGRSATSEFVKIFGQIKGHSILSVSDADNFNRLGGIVRLATEAGKIRLKISIEAAKAAELTISSKILRPSTIVPEEKN
jgi:YfiR/HmsC-like